MISGEMVVASERRSLLDLTMALVVLATVLDLTCKSSRSNGNRDTSTGPDWLPSRAPLASCWSTRLSWWWQKQSWRPVRRKNNYWRSRANPTTIYVKTRNPMYLQKTVLIIIENGITVIFEIRVILTAAGRNQPLIIRAIRSLKVVH